MHYSASDRCWPFAAPYTACFRVSFGDNRRSNSVGQGRFRADTVEKLDINGRLFFCRKVKHSKLLSTLTM
jgi:hypothetical protein